MLVRALTICIASDIDLHASHARARETSIPKMYKNTFSICNSARASSGGFWRVDPRLHSAHAQYHLASSTSSTHNPSSYFSSSSQTYIDIPRFLRAFDARNQLVDFAYVAQTISIVSGWLMVNTVQGAVRKINDVTGQMAKVELVLWEWKYRWVGNFMMINLVSALWG